MKKKTLRKESNCTFQVFKNYNGAPLQNEVINPLKENAAQDHNNY